MRPCNEFTKKVNGHTTQYQFGNMAQREEKQALFPEFDCVDDETVYLINLNLGDITGATEHFLKVVKKYHADQVSRKYISQSKAIE